MVVCTKNVNMRQKVLVHVLASLLEILNPEGDPSPDHSYIHLNLGR